MIKSIASVKVSGRRVIVRAGFDVPLKKNVHHEGWEVVDDARIKDALATLRYLIDQKAKIVIISHLGRPEGWDRDKSLWPVAEKLGELLNYKVVKIKNELADYKVPHIYFLDQDIVKHDYSELSTKLRGGDILFLENVRFYPGDRDNEPKFAQTLASFGEIFVNEAFSVAHHKEASNFGLAKDLPHYAGISFVKEIQSLKKIIQIPAQPFVVIIGGVKIADKVETIHNLAKHAQHILIAGAVADSFLSAAGYDLGQSNPADIKVAKDLLRNYKEKIVLPVDLVVAESKDGPASVVPVEKAKPYQHNFDIGPKTIMLFSQYIKAAKTLVWNGPLGLIEERKFSHGSLAIAQIFAARSKGKAFGVAGGGETVEAIDQAKVGEFIDHVSTGGGAMLEFLAGKTLPAIKVLET